MSVSLDTLVALKSTVVSVLALLLIATLIAPLGLHAQYGSGDYGDGFYGQETADTTAPTLTTAVGAGNGTDAYTGTVSTNEANGTLHWIVNQTGTAPSVSAIKAAESQAVTSTGVQNVSGSGLSDNTTYYIHYVHTDGAGNDSSRETTASFMTASVSDTFFAGDRVATDRNGVRVYANQNSAASDIMTRPSGRAGRVVGNEVDGFSGNRFVFVNFLHQADGYVNIDDLQAATQPPLPDYNTEKGRVNVGEATTTLSHGNEVDINNDNIDDREEPRVASLINKVRTDRERFNTLTLQSDDATISSFRNRAEADLRDESRYTYPVGLYEFAAEVEAGSTETVTIYLDDAYDTTNWVYRKYATSSDTYTDISSSVTYGTAVVDGVTVTTVSYDVLDNGPLDLDDRLGYILDPAGPSEEVSSGGGSSGGGGGGGGGGSSSVSSSDDDETDDTTSTETATTDDTTTVTTPSSVSTSIPQWFSFDSNISAVQTQINDPLSVRYLAQFLNDFEGESLVVDDVYGAADLAAVKRFQQKYKQEILDIWNLTEATGYVGITTRLKLNFLLAGQTAVCPAFTEYNGGRDGIFRSDEVRRTQEILIDLDLFAGPATGIWDPWTHEAMIDFQELFREVMLDPWNITQGTGYKYKTTNKFLNYFVGCDTGAVELEGVGTFDF